MDNVGVLDPLGNHDNPLTGKKYSDAYKKLAKVWSQFPAYTSGAKQHIQSIKDNQVIIITAQTGAGKTVLLPKYALHAYNYDTKIFITLPKKIITKAAAEFASKTLDVELGQEVGYVYRGSPKNMRSDNNKLLYGTDGTLISMLLKDPKLPDFDIVIVDEVHERSNNIDFLIFSLRETLKIRPKFRIILMSATIDTSIFQNYFFDFKYKHISIPGRTFPVSSIFLDQPIQPKKFLDKSLSTIIKILKEEKTSKDYNDILVFITSKNEAFRLCRSLFKYLDSKQTEFKIKRKPFCVELFSGVDPKQQELAQDKDLYKESSKYSRKIVVSTNVAESSLTVDGIKYVIDPGLELSSIFDPIYHAKVLEIKMISQAQAIQRKGRSGRTAPGITYHLYTKDQFDNQMEKFPQPDIRVSDLSEESLRFLNRNGMNIKKLIAMFTNFIEPPFEKYIRSGINTLIDIGLVENNEITKLGKTVVEIGSSSIMDGVALVYSKIYNCSYEMTKIVSLVDAIHINIDNLFHIPRKTDNEQKYRKEMEKFNKVRKKFKHKYGDHLSLLNVYTKFENLRKKQKNGDYSKLKKWCKDNYLKYSILKKATRYYHKTRRRIRNINISNIGIDQREDILKTKVDDRILASLLIAYRTNTAVLSHKTYRTTYSKDLSNIKISRYSYLALQKANPKNIFYNEFVISMGRPTLNIVSVIPGLFMKLLD
uniref:RNA helicase n=1 Tax=Mimivirus LCMiAC01 TaxID=2506608 RepID=A0A481Z001_9VIRU|nr:MAG: HrpA-like RNA helicase [Mimivirus LCMiAC01]